MGLQRGKQRIQRFDYISEVTKSDPSHFKAGAAGLFLRQGLAPAAKVSAN